MIDRPAAKDYAGHGRMEFEFMKRDPSWVKSRIAARILLRRRAGCLLPRDVRLARRFAEDAGVTDRLIGQALASLCAQKGESFDVVLRSTLAA